MRPGLRRSVALVAAACRSAGATASPARAGEPWAAGEPGQGTGSARIGGAGPDHVGYADQNHSAEERGEQRSRTPAERVLVAYWVVIAALWGSLVLGVSLPYLGGKPSPPGPPA